MSKKNITSPLEKVKDQYSYLALGYIIEKKTNMNGSVKYRLLYKDKYDRKHKKWTNWMSDTGYDVDNSIPIKIVNIPGSFGAICLPKEINSVPQYYPETYVGIMTLVSVTALFVGYKLGKNE